MSQIRPGAASGRISNRGEEVMKCPNCGQEVVIATNLCPWCGYKYSFDGSPAPKEPVYEPGDEPLRVKRRRDREHEASEHWTRAGTFTESDRAESRARGEQRGRVHEGGAERGMRWYKFVVNIILPLTFVYYIGRGVSALTSMTTMATLSDWVWYFRFNTGLSIAYIVSFAVYIISGLAALFASKQLKRYEWRGVMLYLGSILLPACTNLAYQVMWMSYFEYYYSAFSTTVEFLAAMVYAALTAVYFSRRRDRFYGGTK